MAVSKVRGGELQRWAQTLPEITGVLSITPHYRSRVIELGAIGQGNALMSFPKRFASKGSPSEYTSPNNAALAARTQALLSDQHPVVKGQAPGLQHTTWMPLLHLRPAADVPVVELALPFVSDRELFELGGLLAPLRHDNVMIMCSGNLTHNLATVGTRQGVAPWAAAFDEWVLRTLDDGDYDAIVDWRRAAPRPYLAHPDDGGHFDVLLIGLGAALAAGTPKSLRFPIDGFEFGTLSKRAIELR